VTAIIEDRADELLDMVAEEATDDAAGLLDAVRDALTRFVIFPSPHCATAVALWIAATHGLPAWQHATRLVILSPQKRCGKSRLLDIVAVLSFSPLMCGETSPAAIFRTIGPIVGDDRDTDDDNTPTLFVDEADVMFGTKRAAEANEDLRGLFNSGWQRGRPTLRCVGPQQVPTPFNTFAMAALAAINAVPDTIADRAVVISLKRREAGETVARYRLRRDKPPLVNLGARLHLWVRELVPHLRDVEPALPDSIEDRAADAWEPLVAIADAAGGHWPESARKACKALTAAAADADEENSAQLLTDIRDVFTTAGVSFMASQLLVRELRGIEDSPWADDELSVSKLARMLKPYGVKPGHNAAKTVRGYDLTALNDAFRRYLRPKPSKRPEHAPEQHEHRNSKPVPNPSATRPPDGSGHLPDSYADTTESSETSAHSVVSDGWTGPDGTPADNAPNDTPTVCRYCRDELPEHMTAQRARGYCHRATCQTSAASEAGW
jgi:hypothetical protein